MISLLTLLGRLLPPLALAAPLAFAQVEPPNYQFSLDELAPYLPGQAPPAVGQQNQAPQDYGKDGELQTLRYLVQEKRYGFAVFVQVKENVIVDFFARLPGTFLHDVFHQSLINRYGKQDDFFQVETNSIYRWRGRPEGRHIYSGTCTITCFPLYYTVFDPQKIEEEKILLQKMSRHVP